ncbi:protein DETOXIFICATION 14-like [Apium graveolens]|uniref:protein DETOXIFICATION 14-like n=1 Tax=Apium graveolens TaxID=4045 RepID=UPI003D7A9D16
MPFYWLAAARAAAMEEAESAAAEQTPENNEEQVVAKSTWSEFVAETKQISLIFLPMVLVTTTQYLLRFVSTLMVGHVGKLYLSGAVVAMSFTNVTGFSFLFGMASALETLCGQAHGAKQHKKLSLYTYGAIISLLLICIPVAILWIFMEKFLILIHQDHLISHEAGKFSIRLIPALFPYAILQPLIRYLQSQYLILPLLVSSIATLAFHVPVCWAFVFKFNMGSDGAALAIGLSYWFNAIFLGLYAMYSPKCAATRAPFSMEVFSTIKDFLRLGIPSALMVCLEWWAYEVVIFLAGIMRNPQLETSVLSISITVAVLHYFAPFALGVAASIRVSNELGAGNPKAVRMTVWVVMVLGIIEVSISTVVLFSIRHVLGRAFVTDDQIVDYVRRMTPFICLTMILDSIQGILSGVARGTGWQRLGAYVNLGSYYLVGVPMALLLGFRLHLKAKGLWIGLVAGALVQSILLAIITSFTNWKKEVEDTRVRVLEMKDPSENLDKSCH